jgi:hypothetical protein
MSIIIFLVIMCAVFYFFKYSFKILMGIVSVVWGIISSLGYILFLIIVSILFMMWAVN